MLPEKRYLLWKMESIVAEDIKKKPEEYGIFCSLPWHHPGEEAIKKGKRT